MAFAPATDFDELFNRGSIAILARHGLIPCNGQSVSVKGVQSLLKGMHTVHAMKAAALNKFELASALGTEYTAVASYFFRGPKGSPQTISASAAVQKLAQHLGPNVVAEFTWR